MIDDTVLMGSLMKHIPGLFRHKGRIHLQMPQVNQENYLEQ